MTHVKKAIYPASLFEELEGRNNRSGGTFSISSANFFLFWCQSLCIFDTCGCIVAVFDQSAKLVKNSWVVFEGHLYNCNFLELQTSSLLSFRQYLCWQIYVKRINNAENFSWADSLYKMSADFTAVFVIRKLIITDSLSNWMQK